MFTLSGAASGWRDLNQTSGANLSRYSPTEN